MKKMNNIYEAPMAEVIELNVCKAFMASGSGQSAVDGSDNSLS
jgi:hypothetical protein